MKSPLEENPKILEKIGLFTVLFNLIDSNLSMEFYYILNQNNIKTKLVLDFLYSQQVSIKLQILQNFTGENFCSEIKEINDFRNCISHGIYGRTSLGVISNTKRNRDGKYISKSITEEILDEYIQKEREILNTFHKLRLERMK